MENKYISKEKAKVDVEDKDKYGMTPAHRAAIYGDTETLKVCRREDIKAKDDLGMTPAHYAAMNGHIEALKYLVEEAKVNVNVKDKYGRTPAHCAAWFGKTGTLKYLIEEVVVYVNIINKNGKTLLDVAYQRFRLEKKEEMKEIIDLLIRKGAKTGEKLREEKRKTFKVGEVCDEGIKEYIE